MVRAPAPIRRNPNNLPSVMLQLAGRHGPLTTGELEDRVRSQFVGYPVNFEVAVRSLTRERVLRVSDDGMAAITEHGKKRLQQLETPLIEGPARPKQREFVPGEPDAVIPSGSRVRLSSSADNRPQPVRPGADNGLGLASRMGDQLHYRCGMVTDLAGNVLTAPKGQGNYRPSHNGQERARPVFASGY
jgi:hypothetical protein